MIAGEYMMNIAAVEQQVLHGDVSGEEDQIANRKTLLERVEEITDFCSFPHKWTLDFRNGNLAGLDPDQECFNRMRGDGVTLRGHFMLFKYVFLFLVKGRNRSSVEIEGC